MLLCVKDIESIKNSLVDGWLFKDFIIFLVVENMKSGSENNVIKCKILYKMN